MHTDSRSHRHPLQGPRDLVTILALPLPGGHRTAPSSSACLHFLISYTEIINTCLQHLHKAQGREGAWCQVRSPDSHTLPGGNPRRVHLIGKLVFVAKRVGLPLATPRASGSLRQGRDVAEQNLAPRERSHSQAGT